MPRRPRPGMEKRAQDLALILDEFKTSVTQDALARAAAELAGVMGDVGIIQGLLDGSIFCWPVIPAHIKGSSIDVTLGTWYFEPRDNDGPYDITDETSVLEYFGEPKRARPNAEVADEYDIPPLVGVPLDHPVIPFRPQQRKLCHTNEFVGSRRGGTSEMRARSSTGRNGCGVCLCAGWGDPNYHNRWTMEFYNFNTHRTMLMPVNWRVAQMVIHPTGRTLADYGEDGKYQSGKTPQELLANWRPHNMLPKSYLDRPAILPPEEEILDPANLLGTEDLRDLLSTNEAFRELLAA